MAPKRATDLRVGNMLQDGVPDFRGYPYLLHRSFERQSAVIAHSTL